MKGNVLKNVALMALGMAAITPGVENVKVQQGVVHQARQKEAIKQPVKSMRQYVKEDAGGYQVISHDNGIPPHIYGQHYVRRGTHKRTNK